MDGIERHALEHVKRSVGGEFDPVPVLIELLDRHIITNEQYDLFILDAVCENGTTNVWYSILEHLQKHCSFLTLIDILMTARQVGLAQILLELIKRDDYHCGITRVNKLQTDKSISLFFKNLLSQVHDARFGNPRDALRRLAKRFQDKLRSEMNASRKHFLADKLVAVLCVEIDAHAITFNDNLSQHELFDQLKSLVHDSSNTMMIDLNYYGRLANANAIGGRFAEAKGMVIKAQCSASNFTACLEVAHMYYMLVYYLLWEFEATHSQKLKESLLQMATKGIASLQGLNDEIRILWTRMFLLRMIFCLLGIGNCANILPGYLPSQEDLMQALNLLKKLRCAEIWNGIETRREMLYWVAMARLNDLNGNGSEARSNTGTALELARSGKFKEENLIEKYSKELENVTSKALKQSRKCPKDFENLKSYTRRMDSFGNQNVHNFDGPFSLQQISRDGQLSDLSDSVLMETVGGIECHITNLSYPSVFGSAKQHHDVYLDSGTSSTNVISLYCSASGSTTFACSYLHHKEEEGGVYLFYLGSLRYNDADDNRNQHELLATNVVIQTNFREEHSLRVSFEWNDDPYSSSSIDTLHLFGSGMHTPEES